MHSKGVDEGHVYCKLGKVSQIVMKYFMNTATLYNHMLRQHIISIGTN